ncbi:hypothetical protein IPH25_03710 [bacterium]|nr:MAG: hypothetical protein IPG37_00705 [bacterium]QQR61559.1 MAG: hypothetical protein IPH25_03710 [bacterium]QQR62907.1 MAG: hypothetical protein IPH67_00245 [bacterium]
MEYALVSLSQAPWYVWIGLVCGISLIIKSTKSIASTLVSLVNLPTTILTLSVQYFKNASVTQLWYFGTASGIGVFIGYFFSYATPFMIWRAFRATTTPGTYHGTGMLALFLGIKYMLGTLQGTEMLRMNDVCKNIDFMVSGFFVGYFGGAFLRWIQNRCNRKK